MSNILEECYSLRDAIESIKNRLHKIDVEANKHREFLTKYKPEQVIESMEKQNWSDKLYLVYRNDYYNDTFYIFKDDTDIENWLGEKWSDWDLWDYSNLNTFFEETLIIWEFHRDICKEKWGILYGKSKQVIDGWSRKRESVDFAVVPSFSIG
jgi:hypothetical protein